MTEENISQEDAVPTENGQSTGEDTEGDASSDLREQLTELEGKTTVSTGEKSPLLSGEETFETLIAQICDGTDLLFLPKRGTIIVTDVESVIAEAYWLRKKHPDAVGSEDIKLHTIADGEYELAIDSYGFYNTVIVKYKGGTVKESYNDLVRAFDEVPYEVEYDTDSREEAQMKAKALLAAQLREHQMSVTGRILYDGDLDVGDIVTFENPQTLKDQIHIANGEEPEYMFLLGYSMSWDASSYIEADVELYYAPASPQPPEVPEYGSNYSKGDVQKAIEEIGAVVSTFSYSSACQTHDCIQEQKTGDCFGLSDYIAVEFAKRGIRAVIYEYPTSVARHHQVKYESNGQLIEFPYSRFIKDHTFYSESIPDDASIFKEYGPGNLTGTEMSNTTTGNNSINNNSEQNSDEDTN